jgi:septal ring factor EnvC (AmiA/AmiB activator)
MGLSKARPWDSITSLDLVIVSISVVVFAFGLGMANGSQDMITQLKEKTGNLQSKSDLDSGQIASLGSKLKKQEELHKGTQSELAVAQKALTEIRAALALFREMDPELDARKEAFVAAREKRAAEQAKAQAQKDRAQQVLAEGQAKIQTLLSNLKGERQ